MNRRIALVRPSQIIDTFFDEFFNSGNNLMTSSRSVEMDMYETDSDVVVEFYVPGFKKEDIKITLEDNILSIEGNFKAEEEKKNRKYHMKEIREESFVRSVSIPCKVEAEKASAKLENGVMVITLPKAEEIKPKSIEIKAS